MPVPRLHRPVAAAALAVAFAGPAHALVIQPQFDASVTGMSNAAAVENAFITAANSLAGAFSNAATVNVKVSWGSVGGQSLPSSALGASLNNLYGYFSYGQMRSWLAAAAQTTADRSAVASLGSTAPAGETRFVLTSAQAKGLGLVDANGTGLDGSIGFGGSTAGYTFDDSNGVAANTYDFVSVATHELEEILGRISGLGSATPQYATALDLFRYSATGVSSFDYNSSAYLSIDGGKTDLGNYNYSGSGDRSDWLSTPYTTDAQDAYLYPGVKATLSTADLTALDVIGWSSNGQGAIQGTIISTQKGADLTNVPEPGTLLLLGGAMLTFGLVRRQRP